MRQRVRERLVVDGVVVWDGGLRWWQLPPQTERTHRGVIRHVLLMLM